MWDATPELVIATESYQHYQDQWAGVLNLPVEFTQSDTILTGDLEGTIPRDLNS
jgi:hypothetical protein